MAAQDNDEDDMYLMVELSGVMGRDWLKPDLLEHFKVIGIDEEKPILQLGQYIFVGEIEDIVGTALFFEQNKDEEGERTIEYIGKTMKKLTMVRAFITDSDPNKSANNDESSLNEKGVKVQGHHTSVIDFKQFSINDNKSNDDEEDIASEEKRRRVEKKKSLQGSNETIVDSVELNDLGKVEKQSDKRLESPKGVSKGDNMETSKTKFTNVKVKNKQP